MEQQSSLLYYSQVDDHTLSAFNERVRQHVLENQLRMELWVSRNPSYKPLSKRVNLKCSKYPAVSLLGIAYKPMLEGLQMLT